MARHQKKNRIRKKLCTLFLLIISTSYIFSQDETPEPLVLPVMDTLEENGVSFNGYPFVFYTPETELAFGAGGIVVFYTAKGDSILPSKMDFGAYYSTLGQYDISVNPSLYFFENKLYIKAPMSYGLYVDKFWGIGNNQENTGNEEFSKKVFSASLIVQSPPIFFNADRAGLILNFNNTVILDKKDNEFLIDNSVPGSDGGNIFGIGYNLTWDNRDNLFFPNQGGYQYLKLAVYPPTVSDFFFSQLELDVRHFWAPKKNHVFAANLYLNSLKGDVPFYMLAELGGPHRMRGFFQGRYRDKFYTMFQIEYRQYFWNRFGFVLFSSIGEVATELLEIEIDEVKFSYGGGLRYLFNKEQHINVRADIGIGLDGNFGVYFGIEEAF